MNTDLVNTKNNNKSNLPAISKPNKSSNIDKSRRLKLKTENKLTYKEIADLEGVTPQAIHSSIKDLLPNSDTELYKQSRADILSEVQRKILTNLDDATIKSLVERRGLVDFGILYDKERLERGQSTENVAIAMQAIQAIRDLPDD